MFRYMRLIVFKILLFSTLVAAKENIAIMEISGTISKSESVILTDKALNLFANSGKYKVIERSMMAEILKEQEFQQTGCTSSECAVQVGQILGVEKIVFGSVGKLGSMYSISLRLINVASGEVIKTASYDLKGNIEEVLVEGIKNVVDQLLEDDNTINTEGDSDKSKKEKKEEVKIVLSPEDAYAKRKRTKKIWTFLNAGGGVVSAGASVYFLVTMNSEKEEYDKMTTGDFEAKWGKVENSRNFSIISGSTAACFTTAAIVLAVLKIETPKGKKVSIQPFYNGTESALTINMDF